MIHETQVYSPAPTASERLEVLESSAAVLLDAASDWMGMRVRDRTGHDLGRIDALLARPTNGQVRFIRIASGGFLGMGADHDYVPVEAVTAIEDNIVRIEWLLDDVRQAPRYAPDLIDERAWIEASYRHFGYSRE